MELKLSGSLAMSGVFSGIDTDALVRSTLLVKQARINALEDRKKAWEDKNKALTAIEGALRSVKLAADGMSELADLKVLTASSSNEDVVQAKVTGEAGEGGFQIAVNRLATSEREVHEGLASLDTLVGSGTFTYSYGGTSRSLRTTATTTLTNLRDLINNDASNPGVRASILEYDAGEGKVYHLVLSGRDSGSDYAIAVTSTPAAMNNAFEQTQTAQNSQIRVDGYPADGWIERSGNVVEDVVPGVRLTLRDVGSLNIAVTRDAGKVKTQVQALVTAYNALVDTAAAYISYDAETKKAGVLLGDPAVHNALIDARTPLVEQVRGFVEGTDTFTHLAQIGLELDRSGKLELDETKLDEAIADDYAAVLDLLAANRTGSSGNSAVQFNSATADTEPGAFTVRIEFDADGYISNATIQHQDDDEPTVMPWVGSILSGPAGTRAEGLELTATYDGDAQETATVRVRRGFAGRLYEVLEQTLDDRTGAISLRRDQNAATITAINQRIERERERLANEEQRLRAYYARMETNLARLDAQRASIDAAIQSLTSLMNYTNS